MSVITFYQSYNLFFNLLKTRFLCRVWLFYNHTPPVTRCKTCFTFIDYVPPDFGAASPYSRTIVS